MAKLRLTKNELRQQKDALKRYNQYLPTLLLKKQQLQIEIQKLKNGIEVLAKEKAYEEADIYKWVDVFGEQVGVEDLICLEKVETTKGNIAGIDIPIFDKIVFKEEKYSFMDMPIWVDFGIESAKKIITVNVRINILRKQKEIVEEELRVTSQRVNLFEKVMIPRAKENIRKIRIYLGDMQTAGVVTGKIAKQKLLSKAKV